MFDNDAWVKMAKQLDEDVAKSRSKEATAPAAIEEIHSQFSELRWCRVGWYRPFRNGNWFIWKWMGVDAKREHENDEWFVTEQEGLKFLESHTPDGAIHLVAPQDEFLEEPLSVQEGVLYEVTVRIQNTGSYFFQNYSVFAFDVPRAEEAVKIFMELGSIANFKIESVLGKNYKVLTLV